ncbi:MAG: hypothetical protein IPN08_17725 [Bacteroidales bacterium]|nr:hypothetical protein [Bacteroidales bacterium]
MNRSFRWLRDHHDILGKIFLFSLIIWLLIMIFPREGKFRYEYQKGKPWQHDDLISPSDFAILKPESELKTEQEAALKDARPYFRRMHSVADAQINYLINSFGKAWESRYGRQTTNDPVRQADLEVILSVLDTLFSHGVISIINEIENKPQGYEIFIVDGMPLRGCPCQPSIPLLQLRFMLPDDSMKPEPDMMKCSGACC